MIDRVCLANFLKTYAKSFPLYFDFDKEEHKRQMLAQAISTYIEDFHDVTPKPEKLFTVPKDEL